MLEALLGFGGIFALSLLRIPIGFSMGIAGFVGLGILRNWNSAYSSATQTIYESGFNYVLSVIPLFILMGNLISRAGMSKELFDAAYAWIGHWRGGLAHATVVASAGFGSVCGSSVATAATMAKVCYGPMKKLGYSDSLAAGSIAAGGTLGILIPPSTVMVIYGIMTETNIGALFAAGMLPGVLAVALLSIAIHYTTWRDPKAGPPGPQAGPFGGRGPASAFPQQPGGPPGAFPPQSAFPAGPGSPAPPQAGYPGPSYGPSYGPGGQGGPGGPGMAGPGGPGGMGAPQLSAISAGGTSCDAGAAPRATDTASSEPGAASGHAPLSLGPNSVTVPSPKQEHSPPTESSTSVISHVTTPAEKPTLP